MAARKSCPPEVRNGPALEYYGGVSGRARPLIRRIIRKGTAPAVPQMAKVGETFRTMGR